MNVQEKCKQIREERGKKYGDIRHGHELLGVVWGALLEEHFQKAGPGEEYRGFDGRAIPPHLVCLMLAGLKLLRAARPFEFDDDHYFDAHNYLQFAHEIAQEDARVDDPSRP